MMRLLCLHGYGSSAQILQHQLFGFLKETGESIEFACADGPIASNRGPGLSELQPGPFFSHTTGFEPDELAQAADHLRSQIETKGPFDGLLGFSQGAALILAFLLHEQAEKGVNEDEDIGVKFAIFFSSTPPLGIDQNYHLSLLRGLTSTAIKSNSLSKNQRLLVDALERSGNAAKRIGVLNPDYEVEFAKSNDEDSSHQLDRIPRILHPDLLSVRLHMPTVHVLGEKDFPFLQEMSNWTVGMCEPALCKVIKHSGGHYFPTKPFEVRKVVAAIEWASQMQRSRL